MEEYTQITLDQWMQWKEDIRRKLAETANNFVYIGYRLKQIRDSGMYDGAADIFEFAQKEFGLGKSTVSRFIAINEKYSEGGNSLELREEYRKFSSSKLSEMLTLPDNEIQLITEKTTIREIRELKSFNAQKPEEKPEEPAEKQERTPLEKCLIDFFKDKKEALNAVGKHLNADPPEYKQAAERMAPSGQTSHRKGILFLFLYDWNTGVKYKLMTQPEPVSMTWPDLLKIVWEVFCRDGEEDIWTGMYGEEIQKEEPKKETVEKADPPQSNQGKENAVATSQQKEEKEEKTEKKTEEKDGDAGVEPEGNRKGAGEKTHTEPFPAVRDVGKTGDAGSEKAESGSDSGMDHGESERTGETETAGRGSEEAAGRETPAGEYEDTIRELIEEVADRAEEISRELSEGKRKGISEYRRIRTEVNFLNTKLARLIGYIELSEGEKE